MPAAGNLLQLDGAAGLLDMGLEGLGVLLADGLLDGVRGLVDERLGLLQAQAGGRADDLDDLDLLLPGTREHDVELGLLLLGGGAVTGGGTRGGGRGGRGGRDAEALLEGLDELGELENGHVLDGLHQFLLVYRHFKSSWTRVATTVRCSAFARRSGRAPRRGPARCCSGP